MKKSKYEFNLVALELIGVAVNVGVEVVDCLKVIVEFV